ncbi:SH3 domain-containing protein [Sinorhizobium medicae]|uniref:SH3 domain-containing protein n=1 Tax=Sinorhizobium medicae TaxID=110321 RepID=UPI000FDB4A89|nr:SH3 domain-containing protein [Sinorhizobium medicae]RVQ39621.1 SH3 domain-containing protein [Sinorhizobium medicae]
MRKRYWIIGAIVIYAISRLMGGGPGGHDVGIAKGPSVSEQQKQPESDSTATSKSAPETALSETTSADARNIVPEDKAERFPVRFISGNRVAFRKGPSTGDDIIDRLDSGRQVLLIKQSGEWSHVREQLTQRDGWMASRFLAERQKPREEMPSEKASKPQERKKSVPTIPDSAIIQRIIAESLASYPSSCACPYNTDRGGRRCGKRSAYSKPGGYAPICYPQDVTKAMIDAVRRQ